MYGSPTTKELKKKHSSRPVGGAEISSRVERTRGKAAAGGLGRARWRLVDEVVPHLPADKPGGTTRGRDRPHNPGFQCGEIKTKSLWLKTLVGVEAAAGETPSLTGEFTGDPQGPRTYTSSHTQESAPEGPNLLVGSRGSDSKPAGS